VNYKHARSNATVKMRGLMNISCTNEDYLFLRKNRDLSDMNYQSVNSTERVRLIV